MGNGHAQNKQHLPTITNPSFCNDDELFVRKLTSGVGHFHPFQPSSPESDNISYSCDAPYNSTENLTSSYVTNENNNNTETSQTL